MADQFGPFDGKDNRKAIIDMLGRLGGNGSETHKAQARARFLRNLIGGSVSGFARLPVQVRAMSLSDSYFAFVAITGALGVPIEQAARLLEAEVR